MLVAILLDVGYVAPAAEPAAVPHQTETERPTEPQIS
jgi:hypothetical protein